MASMDSIHRQLSPRDLHVFKTVAEHGNISKAADSLALSRPVISRTIAGLEHRLGVPLFDRSPQGVEATLYGRALHKLAITVFDDLRHGMQEIKFLADPTVGELRLGCLGSGHGGGRGRSDVPPVPSHYLRCRIIGRTDALSARSERAQYRTLCCRASGCSA
jgi:DNA-binding transcriptional LysR family regulator